VKTWTKLSDTARSWWLSTHTREEFMAAHQRELERIRAERKASASEARVIGTKYGKV
jgi:hypothetical protein